MIPAADRVPSTHVLPAGLPAAPAEVLDAEFSDAPGRGLRDRVRVLIKYRWVAGASFVAVFGLAAAVTFFLPRKYAASTTLQISRQSPIQLRLEDNVLKLDDSDRVVNGASAFLATQVQVLQSRDLAERVIRTHHLADNPVFRHPRPDAPAALAFDEADPGAFRPRGWDAAPVREERWRTAPPADPKLLDQYLEWLDVKDVRGTDLVQITFTTPSPTLSAFLAAAHTQAYLAANEEAQLATRVTAKDFLGRQLRESEDNLERAQRALEAFAAEHPNVAVNQEQKVVAQKIGELSTLLTTAEGERIGLETRYEFLARPNTDPLPYFLDDEGIQAPGRVARRAGRAGSAGRPPRSQPRTDGAARPPGGGAGAAAHRARAEARRGRAPAVRRGQAARRGAAPQARRARTKRDRAHGARCALRPAQERCRHGARAARVAAPARGADRREFRARCLQRPRGRARRGAAQAVEAERPPRSRARPSGRGGGRHRHGVRVRALRSQREEQRRGRGPAAAPDARRHPELSPRAGRARTPDDRDRPRARRRRRSGPRRPSRAALGHCRGVSQPAQRGAVLDAGGPAQGDPGHERRCGRGQDGRVPEPRHRPRRGRSARAAARRRPSSTGLPPRPRRSRGAGALLGAHRAGRRRAGDPRARRPPHRGHSRRSATAQSSRAREQRAHAGAARRPSRGLRLHRDRLAAGPAGDRRRRARPRGRRRGPGRQGPGHAARIRAPGTRSPRAGQCASARRGREQRRPRLGRPLPGLPPLRRRLGGSRGAGMTADVATLWRTVAARRARQDRCLLLVLEALVLATPLLLGGEPPFALLVTTPLALIALALTVRARRQRGEMPRAPGLGALVAFVVLALATTLPLPPALVELCTPATAATYRAVLPGWPAGSGWAAWRPLALDPDAVRLAIARLAPALAVFTALVAYPWEPASSGGDPRVQVVVRLALALGATTLLLAALALLQRIVSTESVLRALEAPMYRGRSAATFPSPDALGLWLAAVTPLACAYAAATIRRLWRRLVPAARGHAGERAWLAMLAVNQRRLWLPLVAAGGALLLLVAHHATGSASATVALFAGLGVTSAGATARHGRRLAIAAGLGLGLASLATLGLWAVRPQGPRARRPVHPS